MSEEQRTLIKRRTECIQQLEKTAGHRLRQRYWHCSGKVRSRDQDRDWPICEWTARFGGSHTEIPRTIISEYVCGGWRYAKILGTHVVKSLLEGQDLQLGFRSKQWNWYCKIVFILIYSKAIKFLFCLGTVNNNVVQKKMFETRRWWWRKLFRDTRRRRNIFRDISYYCWFSAPGYVHCTVVAIIAC